MDWIIDALPWLLLFGLGWAFGRLSGRRASAGFGLGVIASILAFIGLS